MSFSGKVILITGASSGIGATTALFFTENDADVAIVGRNEEKLKKVTKQCEELGKKPLVLKADVSDDDEAKSVIQQTINKFGKLDVLVNNAGILRIGSILQGNILENYDDVIKTNLRAVINLTHLATPHLIKTKGNIVNISSVAGMKIFRHQSFMAYGISKAGLNYFTQGAAVELADHGVRVNGISPGPVVTDILENSKPDPQSLNDKPVITAANRISSTDEVANLILYLASDKAVGITGSNFVLDNGALLMN